MSKHGIKELRKKKIIKEILSELREENKITAGDRQALEIGGEVWERLSEGDPVKQAVWIREVMRRKGWTQTEAAREDHLNLSSPTISRFLRLLELTPKLLDRVRKGNIAKTTAYKLSKLPREKQKEVEDYDKITVEDARDLYRRYKRKETITDGVKETLKSETPSTPQTPAKPRKDENEEPQKPEIATARVAASMDVPWTDQPQKRKAKVCCPHCGRTVKLIIPNRGEEHE